MMIVRWLGSAASLILILIASGFSLQNQQTEVSCSNPNGCDSLISKAIMRAPNNATIHIKPGLYREPTLMIKKSIKLTGQIMQGEERPIIINDDSSRGVVVTDEENPVNLELENLIIRTPIHIPPDQESLGLGVQGRANREISITTINTHIQGNTAVGITATASQSISLTLISSQVQGIFGIFTRIGSLNIRDTDFIGPSSEADSSSREKSGTGVILQPLSFSTITTHIEESRFRKLASGIFSDSNTELDRGAIDLDVRRSHFDNNVIGVTLSGKQTEAVFVENSFSGNDEYGLSLVKRGCVDNFEPKLEFQGTIQGQDNRFSNNGKASICPPDYDWPENFMTTSEGSQ